MAQHNLPNFKIDKENPENGMKELIHIIKPFWSENIIIEDLSGGYSSKIFRCFAKESEHDQVTIRVQNLQDDLEMVDEIEIKAIEHLSVIEHFPTVHATFANGCCYQYVVGTPVINLKAKTGCISEEVLQAIAKEMVFIHSIKLPDTENKKCLHFQKFKKMIQKMPFEHKFSTGLTKEVLLKEHDIIENFCNTLTEPLTLCHGDSHPGNYVWNAAEKKITFVDWELSEISYKFQDISYLLVFLEMADPAKSPQMKIKLPKNIEAKFLKYYYTEWCALNEGKSTKHGFSEFLNNYKKFKLIPLLWFITISLCLYDILQDIFGPGEKYYECWVNDYLELKNELLGSSTFGQ